ncbi:DUF1573 domain-containing protein [Viscerimonas tarda]
MLPEVYNYGEIKKDSLYKGFVIIKNIGRSVLIIKDVSPDCGCTKILLSKNEIEPKDTCMLSFSYNTFYKHGNQENYILITANTDSIVHVLQISAFNQIKDT